MTRPAHSRTEILSSRSKSESTLQGRRCFAGLISRIGPPAFAGTLSTNPFRLRNAQNPFLFLSLALNRQPKKFHRPQSEAAGRVGVYERYTFVHDGKTFDWGGLPAVFLAYIRCELVNFESSRVLPCPDSFLPFEIPNN
jgi:hypothetical protein